MTSWCRCLTMTVVLTACLWAPGNSDAAVLTGDPEAVALAERMLGTLGGRDVWADARVIEVKLRGYYAREHEPWNETFWMDLDKPNGRFELRGGDVDRTIAWTPEGGWELANGEIETFDEERHSFELDYWKRQAVVVFHRLAKGEGIRVANGDNEFRFDVFDAASDELLAQFAVNVKGEPTKWGAKIGEREFEQVLGPLESYGKLRLPRWGATLSAVWRFEHQHVALSPDPISVSLEPPKPKSAH